MRWAIFISILLFILPFFWLQPGQMDLGGDSNRLYFYDPKSFLLHDGLFFNDFVLEGKRSLAPHFYILPTASVLWLGNILFNSPYILISIINGIKISVAFLSIFLILRILLSNISNKKQKNEIFLTLPSILGGLFYITAPIIIGNYEKALITHDQVFLNPLIFCLLLYYFVTQKFRYITLAIITTVLFSANFSWTAAPPLFSFYPLTILFLVIYTRFILKQKIIFTHLLFGLFLFIGLHAFHLLPEVNSLLNAGSGVHERVFDKDNVMNQINYFYGVLPNSKLSLNLFAYLPFKLFSWIVFIPFLVIVLGLIFNKSNNKTLLLSAIFFIITLYLVTANITNAGVKLYESFFYIPGFSMFRNFVGQWAFVFTFFYTLLFGLSAYNVFHRFNNNRGVLSIFAFICVVLIATAWSFFNGSMVNTKHYQSNNVSIPFTMDPSYEKTLEYIQKLEEDGSIISFPFTDCCYSVIYGTNNGAYVGTSPFTALAGKKDYNGYVAISPFSEVFLKLTKEKDYESIKKMLGLLNVSHIYYNADLNVYDSNFPGYPYSTMRQYFPQNQKEYKKYVENISGKKIFNNQQFAIYETDKSFANSHVYAAKVLEVYQNNINDWYGKNMSFFIKNYVTKNAYIESELCPNLLGKNNCRKKTHIFTQPNISYEKINPSKFIVTVKNAKTPYLLVLSETYHEGWDLYQTKDNKQNYLNNLFSNKIENERQTLVNGYANGWYINPSDFNKQSEYKFIIEFTNQRFFYYGLGVTILTVLIGLFAMLFLFRRKSQ